MAIKQMNPITECEHRKYDYVMDTDADAENLPATCASGSTAISVASGNIFMVNASGEWKLLGGGQ